MFLGFFTYLGFLWKREFVKAFLFCAHHYGCQQAAQDWEHWAVGCLLKVVQVHAVLAPPAPSSVVPTPIVCPARYGCSPGVPDAPVLHSCGESWEVPSGLKTDKIPV